MNYKISISNGENDIERYYEESFFNDEQGIAETLLEMKETLDTPYPKKWDAEPQKYLVFSWKGRAGDFAEYSHHIMGRA